MFTIACTIPIALVVGLYMYKLRKGKVVEASLLGAVGVLAATIAGNWIPHSPLEPYFSLSRPQIIIAICVYGFVASVLPVCFNASGIFWAKAGVMAAGVDRTKHAAMAAIRLRMTFSPFAGVDAAPHQAPDISDPETKAASSAYPRTLCRPSEFCRTWHSRSAAQNSRECLAAVPCDTTLMAPSPLWRDHRSRLRDLTGIPIPSSSFATRVRSLRVEPSRKVEWISVTNEADIFSACRCGIGCCARAL